MNDHLQQWLRQIPSIHELLQQQELLNIQQEDILSHDLFTLLCQESVQDVRQKILQGQINPAHQPNKGELEKNQQKEDPQNIQKMIQDHIIHSLHERIKSFTSSTLKPVINGTGVILHTNLGRAKLSEPAQKAVLEVANHYSSLEFNLSEGVRGSRHSIVEELICRLTGAEAALVCNNNAAAVFLTLKELAANQEVMVSRGELVEIGGSFRVSEIMRESGAKLVEVGTTNKTHLYDYEQGFSEQTGMIMKVHTSNFVIKGFTHSVPGADLVQLAHTQHVPVFEDLGSGVLLDLRPYGIGDEPTVQEVLSEGVDLVSFSGDKLLGGPQAGIIAGKKKYIQRLKKNQLMRSLRVDKFTLAALHATLKAYLNPKKAQQEIPTLHMILQSEEEIVDKAQSFLNQLPSRQYEGRLVEMESEVGGGTMPDVRLPSWGVEITSHVDASMAAFSTRMREGAFPVIGRIHQDRFLLDFRTISTAEIPLLIRQLSM